MKFRLENKFSQTIPWLVQHSGYFAIHDRLTDKTSFIRKLTANRYPRFHLYPTETNDEVVFDLHLDQASGRYQNQTAHRADYESEQVKEELKRIYTIIAPYYQGNFSN